MTARPALEAVFFDAGGTLVRLDFEGMAEIVSAHGVPCHADELRRGEVEGRRRYDASRGAKPVAGPPPPLGATGDTRAYFGGMLEAVGTPVERQSAILEAFLRRHDESGLWTRPMEGARAAIDGLLAEGLRLAVISNSDGRAERHLVDCAVREGLEFVIDSHLVGTEKPDPDIFHLALDRMGVAPGRTLFVGDILSVDEAGARAAGTHFVLVDPWGDYAPDRPSIPRLDALPDWVRSRFEIPGRHAAGSVATAAPARARKELP